MAGARNSTRLNYVPMGLVGRARAAGISNFASRVEPRADGALPRLPDDRSPLSHLLFALSAAHPLLAPLPAHLSALLPSPRGAFHRVAGARVTPCRISSFPCSFPECTRRRQVGVSRRTRSVDPEFVYASPCIRDRGFCGQLADLGEKHRERKPSTETGRGRAHLDVSAYDRTRRADRVGMPESRGRSGALARD